MITQLQPISVLLTIPEDSLPMVTRKIRADGKLRDNTISTSKLKAVDGR